MKYRVWIFCLILCLIRPAPAGTGAARTVQELPPGPWGRVRYAPLVVVPPADAIQEFINEQPGIRWFVMEPERQAARRWLVEQGVEEAVAGRLMAEAQRTLDPPGWMVLPAAETVLAMPREQRLRLYAGLAQWKENTRHRNPFRLSMEAGNSWQAIAGLPADLGQIFGQLVYTRGSMQVFADLSLMLAVLQEHPGAQAQFLRSICSERTLLATLFILPGDDIEALVRYWGGGGREEEIRPLIEAAARAEGELGVPVPLLLPGFARQVLYTYPGAGDRSPDCHYTSINFFNKEPDLRMFQGRYRDIFFNAFFEEVAPPPQFGDVIVMLDPAGTVVHSCVHIAGNLVFTKNGGQRSVPWILMDMAELMDYYGVEGNLSTKLYRRQALEGE
jgi:hypothetical protein